MRCGLPLLGFLLFALVPSPASAHFAIDYPDAATPGPSPVPWWHQDALGSPQKLGPCGDEEDATDGGGGPTHAITTFEAGQTISLQWTETISHTGWYRIAIAADRNSFVDPPIVIDSSGNSADAGVEDPPVLPVLADGVYRHTIGLGQTWPPYSITLPKTPCAKCTIQIIQVMLDHPSNLGNLPDGSPNPDGFLYHHCMDVSIVASDGGAVSEPDGGGNVGTPDGGGGGGGSGSGSGGGGSVGTPDGGSVVSGADGGTNSGFSATSSGSGCGCSVAAGGAATGNTLALFGVAVLMRRRAKRRAQAAGSR